jgi:hypothetical protein
MKFRLQDQEFRNPKVFYPDPKAIDLDRVLINLFILLRCDGTRPATRSRQKADVERVDYHLDQLINLPGVSGFAEHRDIAKAWLETDIFDLVNRGTEREAVSSLRPLHLDAHKIRVTKHCRDYNVSEAIYSMLESGERTTIAELRAYLDRGHDQYADRYDGRAPLDLETLTVLKLVEGLDPLHPTREKAAPHPPTCLGQARLLCDDVQRLLAYRDVAPRPVLIDYLKTVLGLHVGLHILRQTKQLTGWIADKRAHPTCLNCPVRGGLEEPFRECPYKLSFVADTNADYRSRMAQMAQESAASEYGRLTDLTRALFTINQLLRYAKHARNPEVTEQPQEVVQLLDHPSSTFDAFFQVRLGEVREQNESREEGLSPDEQAILDAGLPPFDTFIELITQVRQKHHLKYLVELMDKLFQKNTPFGCVAQGKSTANPRRWSLGGRLLEVMVQLAVLKWTDHGGAKRFRSEPILVDDFVRWLESRYGFVVAGATDGHGRRPVTLDEHRAFRENLRGLKDRLREIGFYDDLSDAYNVQTIRPRYPIGQQGGQNG